MSRAEDSWLRRSWCSWSRRFNVYQGHHQNHTHNTWCNTATAKQRKTLVTLRHCIGGPLEHEEKLHKIESMFVIASGSWRSHRHDVDHTHTTHTPHTHTHTHHTHTARTHHTHTTPHRTHTLHTHLFEVGHHVVSL